MLREWHRREMRRSPRYAFWYAVATIRDWLIGGGR
jgi:hypothetical protein